MLKRFLDGIVFGSGFTIALIALSYGAVWLIDQNKTQSLGLERSEPSVVTQQEEVETFGDLSAYEKAVLSSVVLLVEFEKDARGEYRAYISEILKIEPGTDFTLQVGDEYPPANLAARDYQPHSEGAVVMLVGPDARLKTTTGYRRGRIGAFGNITLDTFRKSVELSSTNAIPEDPFFLLPLDEVVTTSSVILDIEFVNQNDTSISGVVKEIIKRDSSLNEDSLMREISVGDNYAFRVSDNLPLLREGDGAIIFWTGEDPKRKLTAAYKDGFAHIGANGRTSIEKVRDLAVKQR